MMPLNSYNFIMDYFCKKFSKAYDPMNKLNYFECSFSDYRSIPDINIQIGNNVYTLPRDKYVQMASGKCYLLIMGMNFGSNYMWILGDNFMQNYLTIYD